MKKAVTDCIELLIRELNATCRDLRYVFCRVLYGYGWVHVEGLRFSYAELEVVNDGLQALLQGLVQSCCRTDGSKLLTAHPSVW